MKHIWSILIIGMLIFSGFHVLANTEKASYTTHQVKQVITLTSPTVTKFDSYQRIELAEATSYLMEPGEPLLPKVTETFILPVEANVEMIQVTIDFDHIISLTAMVEPAREPIIDGSESTGFVPPNMNIYSSMNPYPAYPYDVSRKIGLHEDTLVQYVNIHTYPIRYYPGLHMIHTASDIQINVDYTVPETTTATVDEFDLLVLAPSEFSNAIEPLVAHKNAHNMKTYQVTLEEVYDVMTAARDEAEAIKLFIKQEIETKGITYVLLIGGHIGQSNNWYLPVRYASSPSEEAYLSDLYYADIYKLEGEEIVFEDWDSDGDGKFAEFGFNGDQIDGCPDVYVGRLACRSLSDVELMIQKIITYEEEPAEESWFKNMLLVGGDTYPESPVAFEAEIDTNLSASYMTGFTFNRLWASLGTLTGQADFEEAFSECAGFVHMAGHANPASLVTFPPYDKNKEQKIIIMATYNFADPLHMNPTLTNGEKQPVVLVGGCHNSQFNVSFSQIFREIKEYGLKGTFFGSPYRFFYMQWVPKCWSWWLTSVPDGGSIATIGNSGYGMGIWDYGYLEGLDGWLYPRFFYHYGQGNQEHVGMAQGSAITDYANEFDINKDGEDRQMIQQWILLGDPSLKAGGYP